MTTYTSSKFIADFWKVVIRIEVSYTDFFLRFVCFGYTQKIDISNQKTSVPFRLSRLGCRGVHPPITSFVVSGSCMKCEANEKTLRSPKHSGRVVVLRETATSTFQQLGGGFNYIICFIFTPIWGRFPIWLICFRWVETTNQVTMSFVFLMLCYLQFMFDV